MGCTTKFLTLFTEKKTLKFATIFFMNLIHSP